MEKTNCKNKRIPYISIKSTLDFVIEYDIIKKDGYIIDVVACYAVMICD